MCNKNSITVSPAKCKSVTMKRKRKPTYKNSSSFSSSSSSSSLKPHKRRNRTKTRKPKYLSLRLQLSQTQTNQTEKTTTQQQQQESQLNLFSHHQSDSDMQEENNVALLFTSDGGATLNGLLEDESTTLTATTAEEEESLSVMRCPAMDGLVKKAMRRKRDDEEERWVSYSEVVEEKKEMMEEVNSCVGSETTSFFGSLSLKLDHDGILNAWSDKGSLYVDAADEPPQTVPDLFNASTIIPNVMWDGYGCDVVGNTWKVPEGCGANNNNVNVKEEMGWKLGQREASLLRYKEKRQSRLFAKRIRYEVRKLNAEKRPRMKGRFVKRE
ncbi:zinc finger protein CONSTANS-LIKE 7-like [Vicia villosa]|uniref:zinc finger protein CONSTANS-LIKE 7-like n=1 Tax=Vicia villosa TaxID=3911 RepID=UPI00273B7325|nr:zinc finger protein CONSTANS-LIKE 7-like [Vicia villosa]